MANKDSLIDFLNKQKVEYSIDYNGLDLTLKICKTTLCDDFHSKFYQEFGNFIYYYKEATLQEVLVELLNVRNTKISVGESFTGGRVSTLITSVSGSSNVFIEGIVAYSNLAKMDRLSVNEKTLATKYPVSQEVAKEMCLGLLKNPSTDICLSTTGIAGPNSDNSNFPVGLTYIGVGTRDKIIVRSYNFKGSREEISFLGAQTALFLAIKFLTNGII